MSMAKHVEHAALGEYEGHPILTPLRDANDHLSAVLGLPYRVGFNDEIFAKEIAMLRTRLDLLEAEYRGAFFQ